MSRARDIANYGDGIDATQITSGVFANGRIQASNVTQHEGSIDALASNPTVTLGSNTTFPTNSILQLKHYSRGTSYSDSSIGSSWTNIPSFEVAITPSSASNKILVIANFRAGNNGTTSHNGLNFQFRRDIANAGYNNVGNQLQSNSKDNYGYCITHVMTLIDSPNTTSEIEYTVGYADIRAATGGSIFIGSIDTGIENAYESVIMAMELKA